MILCQRWTKNRDNQISLNYLPTYLPCTYLLKIISNLEQQQKRTFLSNTYWLPLGYNIRSRVENKRYHVF